MNVEYHMSSAFVHLVLALVRVPNVQLPPFAVRADPIAVLAEVNGGHLTHQKSDNHRSKFMRFFSTGMNHVPISIIMKPLCTINCVFLHKFSQHVFFRVFFTLSAISNEIYIL